MPRTYILGRFGPDESTVRRLLSLVPGVTPLPAGDVDGPVAETDREAEHGAIATGGDAEHGAIATGGDAEHGPIATDGGRSLCGRLTRLAIPLLAVAVVLLAIRWLVRRLRGGGDDDGGITVDGPDGPDENGGGDGEHVDGEESEGDRGESEGRESEGGDDESEREEPEVEVGPIVGLVFLAATSALLKKLRSSPERESGENEAR